MPRPPAESTYARIVGEVAIAWNVLERRLDALAFLYLGLDAPVAGFILGEMGNETKAKFVTFLVKRYEHDTLLKEHLLYSITLINRLRENRNIIQHGHPHAYQGSYEGTIYKVSRRGEYILFDAPMSALKTLLKTMREAEPYIRWILFCVNAKNGRDDGRVSVGVTTAEAALGVLSSLIRPQLPDQMLPLPLLDDEDDAQDPNQE